MKGTTPAHCFTLPFDTDKIEKVSVIYVQNGKIKTKKRTEDLILKNNTIISHLTQEDSLNFSKNSSVPIANVQHLPHTIQQQQLQKKFNYDNRGIVQYYALRRYR